MNGVIGSPYRQLVIVPNKRQQSPLSLEKWKRDFSGSDTSELEFSRVFFSIDHLGTGTHLSWWTLERVEMMEASHFRCPHQLEREQSAGRASPMVIIVKTSCLHLVIKLRALRWDFKVEPDITFLIISRVFLFENIQSRDLQIHPEGLRKSRVGWYIFHDRRQSVLIIR